MPRIFNAFLSLALSLAAWPGTLAAPPRGPLPQDGLVEGILEAMTPEERVGQLVIASFYGASVLEGGDIYNLITQYHIGGVIILAANDNITNTLQAPAQVLTLTNELQAAAVIGAQRPRDPAQPTGPTPPYVPLLIAMNHEGDGFPFVEVRSGLTALPSAMAIGATWDPEQAEAVGRITGQELRALGVNLLLGPALDVLETPRPDGADLGTRVFGGDPFWVGQMGQAYIRGVHGGSGNAVAVVAKHFPGHGGSARRPDVELTTVRKSFEDLQVFDLVPFYAVSGEAPSAAETADGMLAAHIRFLGFQGQIRENTAPVSLDPQALGQLLALPTIAAWRANGGVTVSDSLGARAIKAFYDPNLTQFNNRLVARTALMAGNDLLLLTNFGLNPRVDQTANIIDTLNYFAQSYRVDPNFAARVDAAVRRVLALKLRLYGSGFDPADAARPQDGLAAVGRGHEVVAALAQSAAALLSPSEDELEARAPTPPSGAQRMVFFSDVREGTQCSTCPRFSLIERRQLELAVLALYGPEGSGQIRTGNLQSYTFEELADYLANPNPPSVGEETPTPAPSPIEPALAQADWIVFAMLNVTPDVAWSNVVSTFLAQRPDIVRTKRIIVFAFNAPYYLDTTDLSKVTAYYALYSRAPEFVTAAARLLFRDLDPLGAPPVSVASIGYQLIEVTRPDPAQVIELDWQKANVEPEADPRPPLLNLNDRITVTTGVLRDHNGHTVPDQTPVTFRVFYEGPGLAETFRAATVNGRATMALALDRPGRLEITASSDPALASTTLRINVQDEGFGITAIVPTAAPTETPRPTDTPVPDTATPTPSVTPSPTATQTQTPPPPPEVDFRAFMLMFLGLVAVLVGGYRLGTLEDPQPRLGVRVALAGAIGMLIGYNYFALGLPGTAVAYLWLRAFAAPVSAMAFGIVGLAAGWYWFVGRRQGGQERKSGTGPV
jgi:beta-N-acetylhexosaminidase